jgi:ribosome-binding protein aMBF1 (putative translation factor)
MKKRMATMTKKDRSLERMRAAHEAQVAGIRAHPDFRLVSDEFDVEYEVARQMHEARTQAGLTQADLARRMHTTQSVVSRIESGVNVSIETLARFAEACGSKLQVQMVREPEGEYGKR